MPWEVLFRVKTERYFGCATGKRNRNMFQPACRRYECAHLQKGLIASRMGRSREITVFNIIKNSGIKPMKYMLGWI